MNIRQYYLTQNPIYKAGLKFVPKGIMVHSTAAPGVMAADFIDRWNKPTVEKCVHAFVDDKEVIQCLPWDVRGVHCGVAYEGGPSANRTHLSFEMCEPYDMVFHYRNPQSRGNENKTNSAYAIKGIQRQFAARGLYTGTIDGSFGPGTETAVKAYQTSRKLSATGTVDAKTWAALASEPEKHCAYDPNKPEIKRYFEAAYANASELTAMLCKLIGLDPLADGAVICHSEGHTRGIASGHSDVMHWFPLHGQNMNLFRHTVKPV